MISVIGGRIIPSFTRNWMAKQGHKAGLPTQPQKLDLMVIATTAIALLFWLAFTKDRRTGFMLIIASVAQLLRLSRWGGTRATADPLVLVLHLAYAWIPVGLFLLGLAIAGWAVPETAGVHALAAGAMATMILAVMTRASLGHTARPLNAAPLTVAAYACVTLGALVRVAAALGVGPTVPMLQVAGITWAAALVLFLVVYVPVLWRPRLGER
jgi:uncharacterized protein involved in response to NO